MPFCKFRKNDGVYLGGVRWNMPPADEATEIVIELPDYPDRDTERWDGARGVRQATQQEKTAEEARVKDEQTQKTFDEAAGQLDKKINTLIVWIEQLHNIDHADALVQLRAIWKTL